MNAMAIGISIIAVVGILLLILVRGLGLFWPSELLLITDSNGTQLLGEQADSETLGRGQFVESGGSVDGLGDALVVERILVKTGNRRVDPPDFRWLPVHTIGTIEMPREAAVFERTEWGNAYGFLIEVAGLGETGQVRGDWDAVQELVQRNRTLRRQIDALEKGELNTINLRLERLRLEQRRRELDGEVDASSAIHERQQALLDEFAEVETRLRALHTALEHGTVSIRTASGNRIDIPAGAVMRAWQPNAMSLTDKLLHAAVSIWLFLSDEPREANTEGGVFPAIFGTVLMVLLMSLMVTPLGVIAAVYLREYAHQGLFVRLIRIAVNNLAGVPSIVYGVFGLGFFVYFLGGNIDALFFPEALPAPTFGTPGLLWASLTLALLTVPVVIVSTEEGLTRIPRELREGSLALGATKAETLFRVILPMASPSILTGVILAVARAAGEVAPLMLVGVVKLAPTLPLDGNFPFVHLERKFMHLGFHIYDVGFQSPNVEAARPLVFATALLLVVIIVILNLTAIILRNRLERRYSGV